MPATQSERSKVARARSAVLVCGPAGFTAQAIEALRGAGVPAARIASEAFVSGDVATELAGPPAPGPFPVRFARSGVEVNWTASAGTLLELDEAAGLVPPAHCRAGICGTCRMGVVDGTSADLRIGTGERTDAGVLACCSVPSGPLVLDA